MDVEHGAEGFAAGEWVRVRWEGPDGWLLSATGELQADWSLDSGWLLLDDGSWGVREICSERLVVVEAVE